MLMIYCCSYPVTWAAVVLPTNGKAIWPNPNKMRITATVIISRPIRLFLGGYRANGVYRCWYWLHSIRLNIYFRPKGGAKFCPIRFPCPAIFAKHRNQLNFAPQLAQNAAPAGSLAPQLRQNFGAGGVAAAFACIGKLPDFSESFGAEKIAAA